MNGEIEYDPDKIAKFETGAQRSSDQNKGRYDLIPVRPTRRLACKYENGAIHYGERNWEKGMKFSRLISSAKRHIDQFIEGQQNEDHLAAAVWNLYAIMEFQETMPEMDDIHKRSVTIGEDVNIGKSMSINGLTDNSNKNIRGIINTIKYSRNYKHK